MIAIIEKKLRSTAKPEPAPWFYWIQRSQWLR